MNTAADTSIAHLIGKPYAEPGTPAHRDGRGFDCWSLARAAMQAIGWHLPETPGEALAQRHRTVNVPPAEAARAGDLLEMISDGRAHIGVAIDAFRFIHATRGRGVAIDKIAAAQRSGMVRAIHRLRTAQDQSTIEGRP